MLSNESSPNSKRFESLSFERSQSGSLLCLAVKRSLPFSAPWHTNAGKELISHIRGPMKPKKDRDDELGKLIEEEEDEDKVKQLEAEQTQLKDTWSRLDDERKKLGASIKGEQAIKDNEGLERVIKEQRDSATKDWKAAYDSLLKDDKVAAYDSLLKEKDNDEAALNELLVGTQTQMHFSIPIRATKYSGGWLPSWRPAILNTMTSTRGWGCSLTIQY